MNLRFLSVVVVLFLAFVLGQCQSGKDPYQLPDERDECGECLDMPTGEVCTEGGETLRNSCLAICRGYKIKCFQSCPCPVQSDSEKAKN